MKKKPLAVLLAVGLTLMLVAPLAACGGSSATSTTAANDRAAGPGDMSAVFRQTLDALVDEGTITADQEEAVLTAISASRPQGAQGGTPPSGSPMPQGSPPAQTGGQQADRPDPSTMFSNALDDLVAAGTITAAQEEAVLTALSAAMPQQGGAPGA
jgi:hypothetical protein